MYICMCGYVYTLFGVPVSGWHVCVYLCTLPYVVFCVCMYICMCRCVFALCAVYTVVNLSLSTTHYLMAVG